MATRITVTDPTWTFDPAELEFQAATVAKNQGITTQTQWNAFIAGLTSTQSIEAVRKILTAFKCSVP